MNKSSFGTAFALILIAAALFRGIGLDRRPMHHDEANQAVKFGALLDQGDYRYDPKDHHGPSLYYLTLPAAWAASTPTLASLNEKVIRMVPALFGVLLIFLILLFGRDLGREAKLAAGLLAALSPIMVFFSRFYIQEMLLAAFGMALLACMWSYTRRPSRPLALWAGISAGMMYATKETSLIMFAALAGALVLTVISERGGDIRLRARLSHVLIFLTAAVCVAFLLFSSFFQHLSGPVDSLLSFRSYIGKAAAPGWHTHPWSYYLGMLTYWKLGAGPVWSEALVVGLALLGAISAASGKVRQTAHPALARYILFYTCIITFLYSAVPYKTPWNAVPFYTGFLLLAGLGAASLFRFPFKTLWPKAVLLLLFFAGAAHLGWQSYRGSFIFDADTRNPHVYAHTSRDFLNMVKRISDIATIHPDGEEMLIKIFAIPYETWPLPWYLRRFSRVGYWTDAEDPGSLADVPVIIASPDLLDKLQPDLAATHLSEFYGLRHEVLTSLHIRRDLWDKFLETRK